MRHLLRVKTGMKHESGFSILEVLVASMVMLIGIAGLMALFAVAAAKNAGQGNQSTRCTEFAQDKMEQLLALQYGDTTSYVVGSTTTPNYGTSIGLSIGGGIDPNNPVTNYVDYVNPNDNTHPDGISASNSGAQYMREWWIQTDPNNVKSVTVRVQAQFTGFNGIAPSITLIGMKQQY